MLSLLVISDDESSAITFAKDICTTEGIDSFDMTFIDVENTLGIEEIRNVQKKIFLKPFKGEKKAIILQKAHLATIEAQNALLKILEEPPANTRIIVLASSKEAFLPTILSRCKIIVLDKPVTSHQKYDESDIDMDMIEKASISKKLFLAQQVSENKQDALSFLKSAIALARKRMLEKTFADSSSQKEIEHLTLLLEMYQTLSKTNTNARMIFEQLFLQLS